MWRKPIARTVTRGVEGIRVGRTGLLLNTAVWFYRVGDVLIDTGCPNQKHVVRKYAESRKDVLKQVILSHHHEDHAGNGKMLKEEFGLDVFAPRDSIEILKEGFTIEYYRRMVWGSLEPFEAKELENGVIATLQSTDFERDEIGGGKGEDDSVPLVLQSRGGGERVGEEKKVEIRVVQAPGHCSDHSVFHCPSEGWLFSADLLVTPKPKMARFDEDILAGMYTLERILDELDFDLVFCAHRGPVKNGRELLERRWKHLRDLRVEVLRKVSNMDSAPDFDALAKDVLGSDGVLGWFSRGDFSGKHLVRGMVDGYDSFSAARRAIGRPHTQDATVLPLPKGVKVSLEGFAGGYGPHLEIEGATPEAHLGLETRPEWAESPEQRAMQTAAIESQQEQALLQLEYQRARKLSSHSQISPLGLVASPKGKLILAPLRPPAPLTSAASIRAALQSPDPLQLPGAGDPTRPFSSLPTHARINVAEFTHGTPRFQAQGTFFSMCIYIIWRW